MAIEFLKLPYSTNALEPYISERTLQFHYGKHHKNYVETLNKLIQGTPLDERNPLAEFNDTPLLACDVWEHAYYLDYQNERPKFLENFWKVASWEFVEINLELTRDNREINGIGTFTS